MHGGGRYDNRGQVRPAGATANVDAGAQRIEIVEATVATLLDLGAGIARRDRDDDPGDPVYYVVMHDPEGNEFCVS